MKVRSLEEKNKAVVHRWFDEMYGVLNFDIMPELAGPLYLRHESSGTFTVSVEDHMEVTKDRYIKDENTKPPQQSYRLIAENDMVCVVGSSIAFRKGGDTDHDVLNFVQAFRLENEKIVETWFSGFARNVEW